MIVYPSFRYDFEVHPTTMGVKEEVILTSNVGKNAFSFLIETGGLTIAEENGSYYFFDPDLDEHPALRQRMERMFTPTEGTLS